MFNYVLNTNHAKDTSRMRHRYLEMSLLISLAHKRNRLALGHFWEISLLFIRKLIVKPGCLGSGPFLFFFSTPVAFLLFILVEEIEQMNNLFQQKQRELVLAVSKVEELTRQLEMLKNGRIDGHHDNQSAVAELDRLYKELQVNCGLLVITGNPPL